MEGVDRTLTASMNEDFMDLWKEDVLNCRSSSPISADSSWVGGLGAMSAIA